MKMKDGTVFDTTGEHNKAQDEKVLELIDAGFVPDELELAILHDPRSTYTPQQKVTGCAYYMVYGNSKEVERRTGIPAHTIRQWKSKADWWIPTLAWLRKQKQDELDSHLTNIIHSGIDEINDRIQNGDTKVVRGELIKVPMTGKDLAYVASIMFDKRALIRGDVTSIQGKTISNLEQIQQTLNKTLQQAKEKDVVAEQPAEVSNANNT